MIVHFAATHEERLAFLDRVLVAWEKRPEWTFARHMAYALAEAGQPSAALGDGDFIAALERRVAKP